MSPPSTDWREIVTDAEADRHREFAERLVGIAERVDRKQGPGRALHRKQVLGVRTEFEVLADMPEYARQGLFARPAVFRGYARLSNGTIRAQPDATPDIRGLAFSVRGLQGEGVLGGTTDRQDFVLINRPSFGFTDSQAFTSIVLALAEGNVAFLKVLVSLYGPVRAPLEAARLTKDLLRPFSGFATEPFYSAAPLRWGPYAVKLRLRPNQGGRNLRAALDYGRDMADRLVRGPVTYDLDAQFFTSEDVTPIEDGSVDWPQDSSPFVTVGRLTIPQQDPDSDEGRALAERIEKDRFDPWSALVEHRPLGEIMRARKAAYYPSQKHRHATGT